MSAVLTPGIWEAGQHPAVPNGWIVRPVLFGANVRTLPECEGGHVIILNEADALVMAAAKDLLEALKGVAGVIAMHATLDAYTKVFNALEKAERGVLCEDCPPVGYPTDETRCNPCPRRTSDDIPCTDCEGTGITIQTERQCACQADPRGE